MLQNARVLGPMIPETVFGYLILLAGLTVCPPALNSRTLWLGLTRGDCIYLIDTSNFTAA
jgi:hypothetical protein